MHRRMVLIRIRVLLLLIVLSVKVSAQEGDSIKTKLLKEVEIKGDRFIDLNRLPKVSGTYIWSGARNEVIQVQNMDINLAEKTPRQFFSKVPGIFVYDMDGSGNAIAVWTHTGWQDDVPTSAVVSSRFSVESGWGPPEVLSGTATNCVGTESVVSSSGDAFVVWQQYDA